MTGTMIADVTAFMGRGSVELLEGSTVSLQIDEHDDSGYFASPLDGVWSDGKRRKGQAMWVDRSTVTVD